MTPRAEEVWSYFIGRRPVGELVSIDGMMIVDLKLKKKSDIYPYINELMDADCIRQDASNGYTVLRRIGPHKAKPAQREKRVQAEFQATKAEAAARLAEIPKFDTRSLTGRIAGDPLPERSALAKRLVSA